MLIPELGFGGAEKSFIRLSKLLSEYHDVSLVVFKRHYATGDYSKNDEEISLPLTILDSDADLCRFKRWLNRWNKLRALKKKSDITISFLTGANMLNVITGGGRRVISMRGSRHYDPAITGVNRLLYEYIIDPITFKLSDRVVSISDGLSIELGAHVGWRTRDKIKTIELFVDAEDLIASSKEPIEEDLEKLKGQPVIITAGRLSPEKGFQFLVPIFSDVRRRVPDAKLVFIGDGPLQEKLVNLCKSLELPLSDGHTSMHDSAVIFLGYRKNPLRYFRISSLFVLSSLTEGFSNVVIEALAAGIPVIATNCPWGPRSILWNKPEAIDTPYPTDVPTQADYGMLMPRIDQGQYHTRWVDTLCEKLINSKYDSGTAEKGRVRVRYFDAYKISQKWLDLIDELN